MQPIIETNNLTKRYGSLYAVKDINLQICRGEIYGFVGLNGAGKTTLMRLLLGMIRPTNGHASIQGVPVHKRPYAIWRKVGYLIETATAYPDLTVGENVKLACRLRSVPKTRIDEVLDLFSLTTYRKKKAKDLSLGNKQRLALAKVLLHRPTILLLDEPVNGLDPAGIMKMRSLLQHLAEVEKTTIVVSSHLLDEMSQLAHRIGFIHDGSLITEKKQSEMETALKSQLVIETNDARAAKEVLKKIEVTAKVQDNDTLVIADSSVVKSRERIAHHLVRHNVALRYFAVESESLENYFLRLIKTKE